jgi:acylphosphatase
MPTVRLLIKGKVQGVFYRASAKDVAAELGIKGWICNTRSGDVEALISGTAQQVQQFRNWCIKGPVRAVVDSVVMTEEAEIEFDNFSIRR